MLARLSKTPLLNVQRLVLTRTFIATPAIRYERDSPSFSQRARYTAPGERGRRTFQPRGNDNGNNTCHHCGSADHFVRDCPEKPKVSCFRCGQEGHISRDCTSEVQNDRVITCHNCGQEGHIARMCPEPRKPRDEAWQRPERSRSVSSDGEAAYRSRQPRRYDGDNELSDVSGRDDEHAMRSQFRDESEVTCWTCNEKGHSARNCPSKPVDTCWNCGGEGHRSHDCPEPRKERGPRSSAGHQRGPSNGAPRRESGGRGGGGGGRGGRTRDQGWQPRRSSIADGETA